MILATSRSGGRFQFLLGLTVGAALTALGMTLFKTSDKESKGERALRGSGLTQSSRALHNIYGNSSFLTDILEQLWSYMRIAGADTIRSSVEPSFADLPGPMKTTRFTKIDLGDIPIRMDNIVVHPIRNGMVQFDLDCVWDGECDIQLKADYIGSFGVKHLKLSGRMAILLKPLTNELPVVSGIQYGFINPPKIEMSFSGFASVAELSVLETTVQEVLQSSLATTVLPNRRLYKMSATNNYLDTYQPPMGVLRLKICDGRGFIIEKRLLARDDIPDVYLNVSLAAMPTKWRTKTIDDDLNPVWDEQGDFCLFDREQMVTIHAWDEDEGPLDPDDDLGKASVAVGDMLMSPQRRVEVPLLLFNKKSNVDEDTGASVALSCDILEWTTDLSSLDSVPKDVANPICGLLVVITNRAFELPLQRKTASTYVKVSYSRTEHISNMIYDYPGWDSLNPCYDSAFTIPITADMERADNAEVLLELIDAADDKLAVLGSTLVTFGELKKIPDHTLTERRPIGKKGASLEFRVSLSGVQQAAPGGHPSTPRGQVVSRAALEPGTSPATRILSPSKEKGGSVGTMKLTVVSGRGLSIQEELFNIDVPDVFCVVEFEGERFQTSVQHNNVTPVWKESKEWELKDHGQIISVTGWDRNEREEDPDIRIGTAKVTVGKLLLAGGSMDLELKRGDGRSSGVYIAVRCDLVE